MITKSTAVMATDKKLVLSGMVPFTMREDDENTVVRKVEMTFVDWAMLGSPSEITVTIEPGDKLNPDQALPLIKTVTERNEP